MLLVSTEPQSHDGGTGCNPDYLVEPGAERPVVEGDKVTRCWLE